ncbi:TolC family protein [Xylophilus sp. GW821-FHT01B05]
MSARLAALAALLLLAGCTSVAPDGLRGEVSALAQGRTGVDLALPAPGAASADAVAALLQAPLTQDAAVRIALLQSPALQGSLATLGIADAERVQAATLPNPGFAIGRLTEGSEREIERSLSFSLLGLLTLPWRADVASRQLQVAKLQAAQDVVRLAANVRRAWVRAVAAGQSATAAERMQQASAAGAELAQRMARVGNWSTLQQSREQLALAESTAQLARARQAATREREALAQLLGLWGTQAGYRLPERLPELPAPDALPDGAAVEATALRERLDVRLALERSQQTARALGLTRATAYVSDLDIGYVRNSRFDDADGARSTKRGWELALPIPLFDWGQARTARARSLYLQSTAQVEEAAVRARSEARSHWLAWRTAYDLARHYRDEVVPLRSHITDETVLRYNGMLASVWELLAEARASLAAVDATTAAERDFWLADTDLRQALTGGSPGAATTLAAAAPSAPTQGH